MVPEKRTGAGDGNFQCRSQCRRHCHPFRRDLDRGSMGMALGVSDHGSIRVCLAHILAAALSPAGRTSSRFQGRTGLHPQRSSTPDGQNRMGPPHPPSSDLGVRHSKIHDRPDLVVLSFLDTGFSATQAWTGADEYSAAYRGDLCHRRCRQRRRWLAFILADPSRPDRECGPQDCPAGLCAVRCSRRFCLQHARACGERSC